MKYFDGQIFPMWNSHPVSHGFYTNHSKYYGIQYNHSGPLTFSIDGSKPVKVNGPHVFFTCPGHVYQYGCEENKSRHHCFICSQGERMRSYVEGGLFPTDCIVPIPVKDSERFYLTMLEIMSLLRKSPIVPPRAVLLYEDLLLQAAEAEEQPSSLAPYCRDKIAALAERIRANPEQDFDFDAAAADCAVTLPHFRRLFKQVFALPPQQYLIRTRLQTAAALLIAKGTPLSIGEVAERSGFTDQNYFSRLFKQHYRISPMEYRREFQ